MLQSTKLFKLTDEEAAEIAAVEDRGKWSEIVKGLREIAKVASPERRPIRLRIPPELQNELAEARKTTGRTKTDFILAAAREYRRRYPLPNTWADPIQDDSEVFAKRDRNSFTLRLWEDDRELLRNLGRGRKEVPDRHAALILLAPIVRELAKTIGPPPRRKAVRVCVPPSIVNEIKAAADKSDRPMRDVFVEAVQNVMQPKARRISIRGKSIVKRK